MREDIYGIVEKPFYVIDGKIGEELKTSSILLKDTYKICLKMGEKIEGTLTIETDFNPKEIQIKKENIIKIKAVLNCKSVITIYDAKGEKNGMIFELSIYFEGYSPQYFIKINEYYVKMKNEIENGKSEENEENGVLKVSKKRLSMHEFHYFKEFDQPYIDVIKTEGRKTVIDKIMEFIYRNDFEYEKIYYICGTYGVGKSITLVQLVWEISFKDNPNEFVFYYCFDTVNKNLTLLLAVLQAFYKFIKRRDEDKIFKKQIFCLINDLMKKSLNNDLIDFLTNFSSLCSKLKKELYNFRMILILDQVNKISHNVDNIQDFFRAIPCENFYKIIACYSNNNSNVKNLLKHQPKL
jgi:hypothetical protein